MEYFTHLSKQITKVQTDVRGQTALQQGQSIPLPCASLCACVLGFQCILSTSKVLSCSLFSCLSCSFCTELSPRCHTCLSPLSPSCIDHSFSGSLNSNSSSTLCHEGAKRPKLILQVLKCQEFGLVYTHTRVETHVPQSSRVPSFTEISQILSQ